MKNKPVYFSIGFLLLFLTSFSANTYVSLNSPVKNSFHFSKNSELKQNASCSDTEDLVFEETENDSEESLNDVETILPTFLNFQVISTLVYFNYSESFQYEKKSNPIFLNIHSLRI